MNVDEIVARLMDEHTKLGVNCGRSIHRVWACQCKIEAAIREAILKTRKAQWIPVSEKPKDKEIVWVLVPNLTIGGRFVGWRGFLADYNADYDDFGSTGGITEFVSDEIQFWKSASDLPEEHNP